MEMQCSELATETFSAQAIEGAANIGAVKSDEASALKRQEPRQHRQCQSVPVATPFATYANFENIDAGERGGGGPLNPRKSLVGAISMPCGAQRFILHDS